MKNDDQGNVAVVAAATPAYELRYRDPMALLPECPCAPTGEYQRDGYHLVQANLLSAENFLPKGIKDAAHYPNAPVDKRCPWWGLSMFETPEQLRTRFGKTIRTNPQVAKLLGEYFVRFQLDHTLGRASNPSSKGHFEFFEYGCFDPRVKALDHKKLNP